jgi:cell wall-associated NlpC family hydrolase
VLPERRHLRMLVRAVASVVAAVAVLAPATAANAGPSGAQIDAQINAQAAKLEQVVEAYNKINSDLTASQGESARLSAEIQPLAIALAAAHAKAGQIAALAYEGGPLVEVSAVLTATDARTLVNRLLSVSQLSTYQHDQITNFARTKIDHDARAATLQGIMADQTAKRQALVNQRAQINADIAKLQTLRTKYGRQPTAVSAPTTPPPYVAGKAGVAVTFAYAQIGKPYVWASAGPSSFDCSGLTMAAWGAAGVSLPHNAAEQWNSMAHLTRSALQPGDLVFYSSLGHVAIYVGNGQVIHAPSTGDHVRLASVDMTRPYGYGRPG